MLKRSRESIEKAEDSGVVKAALAEAVLFFPKVNGITQFHCCENRSSMTFRSATRGGRYVPFEEAEYFSWFYFLLRHVLGNWVACFSSLEREKLFEVSGSSQIRCRSTEGTTRSFFPIPIHALLSRYWYQSYLIQTISTV